MTESTKQFIGQYGVDRINEFLTYTYSDLSPELLPLSGISLSLLEMFCENAKNTSNSPVAIFMQDDGTISISYRHHDELIDILFGQDTINVYAANKEYNFNISEIPHIVKLFALN